MSTDLLGTPVSATDEKLLTVFARLKDLVQAEDLSPSVAANLRQALAHVAVATNGAALTYEHLIDQDC